MRYTIERYTDDQGNRYIGGPLDWAETDDERAIQALVRELPRGTYRVRDNLTGEVTYPEQWAVPMTVAEARKALAHVWPITGAEAEAVLEAGHWASGEAVTDEEGAALEVWSEYDDGGAVACAIVAGCTLEEAKQFLRDREAANGCAG